MWNRKTITILVLFVVSMTVYAVYWGPFLDSSPMAAGGTVLIQGGFMLYALVQTCRQSLVEKKLKDERRERMEERASRKDAK